MAEELICARSGADAIKHKERWQSAGYSSRLLHAGLGWSLSPSARSENLNVGFNPCDDTNRQQSNAYQEGCRGIASSRIHDQAHESQYTAQHAQGDLSEPAVEKFCFRQTCPAQEEGARIPTMKGKHYHPILSLILIGFALITTGRSLAQPANPDADFVAPRPRAP